MLPRHAWRRARAAHLLLRLRCCLGPSPALAASLGWTQCRDLLHRDLRDTARLAGQRGSLMRIRSAHFAALTMVGCCALMPLGQDAHGADPAVAPVATAVALPDFQA